MRKKQLILLAMISLAMILSVGACSKKGGKNPLLPTEMTFSGRLFGITTVPRDSLPEESRPEHFLELGKWYEIPGGGQTKVELLADGTYEFRRTYPTDSLEIMVDEVKAEIQPDGAFSVSGLPEGQHTIRFIMQGKEIRIHQAEFKSGQIRAIDIYYNPMKCEDQKIHQAVSSGSIPCLDNNGVGWLGFTYSDCWISLFFGPRWYNWMCWSEAMNSIHDHHGNIWCDGSHNCSLFVHGWDWNKQFWHRHSTFWWPKY